MTDVHTGEYPGDIGIKRQVGLATTVIGVHKERLTVVLHGKTVGIRHRQHAFGKRQAPANDIACPAINNQG
ncbi:hypothetical protein D3C86_2063860 [compost metagenome]